MADMQIPAHETLDLQEVEEDFSRLDSDVEEVADMNKKRKTEGFGGSILIGRSSSVASVVSEEATSPKPNGDGTPMDVDSQSLDEGLYECATCRKMMAVYISPGQLVCLECSHP
jgi:hypothetical protein